jgi:hypothetical protein
VEEPEGSFTFFFVTSKADPDIAPTKRLALEKKFQEHLTGYLWILIIEELN